MTNETKSSLASLAFIAKQKALIDIYEAELIKVKAENERLKEKLKLAVEEIHYYDMENGKLFSEPYHIFKALLSQQQTNEPKQ